MTQIFVTSYTNEFITHLIQIQPPQNTHFSFFLNSHHTTIQ
jgi:hypothetical protein